jgi:hypothetical protein
MLHAGPAEHIARHLAGRGLILVPLYPVMPDGLCCCGAAGAACREDPHAAGKHPRFTDTGRYVTAGPAWWKRHPRDGVGVDRQRSRIVTVEDDGGLREWIEAAGVPLPPTLTMASPARRLRFFCRLPDAFTALRNHVSPGGYAVDVMTRLIAPGPGARSAGGAYVMVRDLPVSPAPAALVTWLEAHSRPSR